MDYPEGIACPMAPKRLFIRLLTIGGGSFYLGIWSSKDLKWNRHIVLLIRDQPKQIARLASLKEILG